MRIRRATVEDITFIDHLRKQESEAVGFIPLVRYEMEIEGERHGSILVCEENSDMVGFIYATHGTDHTHIQQIVIQEDARRRERGLCLVAAVTRPQDWLVSLRCADDLEAAHFWDALGFSPTGHVQPKSVYGRGKEKSTLPTRRKRCITKWERIVGGLWKPT